MVLSISKAYVEAVACCIVHEYLFRKSQQIADLRDVLSAMEKAFPRSALCFQQRDQLIRAIHLEKPCRENKNSEVPFKTLLEIILADRLEKHRSKYVANDMGRFGVNVRIETVENAKGESRNEVVFSSSEPSPPASASAPTVVLTPTVAPASVEKIETFLTPPPVTTKEMHIDVPSATVEKKFYPWTKPLTTFTNDKDGFSSDDDDDDEADERVIIQQSIRQSSMLFDTLTRSFTQKWFKWRKDREDKPTPQSARFRLERIEAEQAKGNLHQFRPRPLQALQTDSCALQRRPPLRSWPFPEPTLRSRRSAWSNLTRLTTGSVERHQPASPLSSGVTSELLHLWPAFGPGSSERISGNSSATALLERTDGLIKEKSVQTAALPVRQTVKKIEFANFTRFVKKKEETAGTVTVIRKRERISRDLQSSKKKEDILREDIINQPDDHCIFNGPQQQAFAHRKITVGENEKLQMLLFGNSSRGFGLEWLEQKLEFAQEASLSEVSYGLKQNRGGPCGVLAVTQAYLLKNLFWPDGVLSTDDRYQLVHAPDWRRRNSLMMALREIIIQSNPPGPFKYVLGPVSNKQRTPFTALTTYHLPTPDQLSDFLTSNLSEILQSGVVQLLLSVVLSRGVDVVRQDMDQPNHPLIGRHNHTSQEVVNLMLFGRASSNLFDGALHMDATLLRGVPQQSTCGLLSLMESTGIIEVGSFLKSPKFPIWVLLAENHYFVLFGTSGTVLTTTGEFRLYAFVGLASQSKNRVIRVDPSPIRRVRFEKPSLGPTELCIKTKWKHAFVEDCSPPESSTM